MPIYFNSAPTVNFPFQFDSIGNNWDQEPTLAAGWFPGLSLSADPGRMRHPVHR